MAHDRDEEDEDRFVVLGFRMAMAGAFLAGVVAMLTGFEVQNAVLVGCATAFTMAFGLLVGALLRRRSTDIRPPLSGGALAFPLPVLIVLHGWVVGQSVTQTAIEVCLLMTCVGVAICTLSVIGLVCASADVPCPWERKGSSPRS